MSDLKPCGSEKRTQFADNFVFADTLLSVGVACMSGISSGAMA
jgi:hypothetical protein